MKVFIDFGVLILIYFLKFYKKWKNSGKDKLFINTTMYLYLSFVLYFTLMPIITSIPFVRNHPYKAMNLEPFVDVLKGRGDFIRQVGLNVIMTIPFGFLFPLLKKENAKLTKVIKATVLLSLSIELLQPLINQMRSSDITDIITNGIGGILGYILYLLLRPLTSKGLNFIKKS